VTDLADRVHLQDPPSRFRRKIAENARAWLGFVRDQRLESPDLTREFANVERASVHALREPAAWADGVRLVIAIWPFVDLHGYWLRWRSVPDLALVICRRLGDLAGEVAVTDQMGEIARNLGENRAALARQEEALTLARRLGDQAMIGRVLIHLSQQYLPQGQYQAAQACCEEAIALLEPLDAEAEIAIAHNNWGIACLEGGQMTVALPHLVLAESMFEAQGNRRGQAKALHNQGEAHLRQGRWTEAGPLYDRSIALSQAAGDEFNAVRSRLALAILLHQQGQHETALNLHLAIAPFYRRLGLRPMLARVTNNQGAFLIELGRQDEAALAFEQAAQLHRESGNLGEAATSLLNWCDILLARNAIDELLARLEQVKALLDAQSVPAEKTRQRYAALLEQALAARAAG